MKSSRGYILFFCIMMVSLLSLLTLSQFRSVYIFSKTVAGRIRQHQQDYQLEKQGILLTKTAINPRCVGPEKNSNDLIRQLMTQRQGCRLDKGRMVYWIEDLGIDDCLQVVYKNQNHASHHFRFTVALPEASIGKPVLQFHFVKIAGKPNCLKQAHKLAPGITSWRRLGVADY